VRRIALLLLDVANNTVKFGTKQSDFDHLESAIAEHSSNAYFYIKY